MNAAEIAAIVMAVGGLIGGAAAWFKGKSLEKATAAKTISDAASALVDRYRDRLDELEEKTDLQQAQIDKQEIEISKLKRQRVDFLRGVRALCEQIRSLGQQPVWEPVWDPDSCDWKFLWHGTKPPEGG